MHDVDLYFDFVSPYSWLALARAEAFAARHDVRFAVRPVVYAALLDATGLVGPAEAPSKRRYTFVDVLRCARALGLRLVGPPAHPFRSLEALRLVTLHRDRKEALPLAVGMARACWEEGEDLTDAAVLATIARGAGVDAPDLAERVAAPEVKAALRATTAEALRHGVFGVPTFVYRGELFWGHDRMDALADALAGGGVDVAELERFLDRPRGADRPGRPGAR